MPTMTWCDRSKRRFRSYHVLQTVARDTQEITALRAGDKSDNDRVDTSILAELVARRVDYVLTEDRGIHRKGETVGLGT